MGEGGGIACDGEGVIFGELVEGVYEGVDAFLVGEAADVGEMKSV